MTADIETRRARILCKLDEDIKYFDVASRTKRILYRTAQLFSLGCGTAVPVLIVAEKMKMVTQSIALATLAAMSAFATAAIGLFKLREEWIQHAVTREALINERLAFVTQVGEYKDPELALGRIVARRRQILDANLGEWRQTLVRDGTGHEDPTGDEGTLHLATTKSTLALPRDPLRAGA